MTSLDLNFIRSQFPAFSQNEFAQGVFMENAGGSLMCRQVMQRLEYYYRHCKVQPYYANTISATAGNMMDESYTSLAPWLNVAADEIYFGPSTSQNTYVLANAMLGWLQAGDEIIVTNQDHEANSGCWRRLASRGVVVKEWKVDAVTGSLSVSSLYELISPATKLLTFPHCSNIVGEINPVKEICALARQQGIKTVVDGVSFCGHSLPDIAELDADIYLFSLYKVYGPHQGVMIIRAEMADYLAPQSHFFLHSSREKKLLPAGPDHAQIASIKGVSEYFDCVYNHHFPHRQELNGCEKAKCLQQLFESAEALMAAPLITFLNNHKNVRLLGPSTTTKRAPTISFTVKQIKATSIEKYLGDRNILCGAGHFYAHRLMEALGIRPEHGAVRLSMVHYNSREEVEQVISALIALLGHAQ